MQFMTSYSSTGVAIGGSLAESSFVGWFRDQYGALVNPLMRIDAIIPLETKFTSVDVPLSTIVTSKAMNPFGDHACHQTKFDGFLEADLTSCDLVTGSPQIPQGYSRGRWSSLDYRLPSNIGSSRCILPINKDFYLNYWEPEQWDDPNNVPQDDYTTHNYPRLNTVRSVVIDGYCVMLSARLYFQCISNEHITDLVLLASVAFCDENGINGIYSQPIREMRNVGGWNAHIPNYSGFETEVNSLIAGELPFTTADFEAVNSVIRSLQASKCRHCTDIISMSIPDSISLPSQTKMIEKLDEFFQSRMSKISYPDILEFWELAELAIQDCQSVGINSIGFLRDLPDFGQDIRQISQTVTKLSSKKKAIRALAKQFLALNYGSRLTVSDAKELKKSLSRRQSMTDWSKDFSKVHSQSFSAGKTGNVSVSSSCERHYKVYYNPNDSSLCRAMKGLNDLGLYPTGANLWDLIPFSFVVDWFVNVGDVLTSIDISNYCIYLDILSCIYSEKSITTVSGFEGFLPFKGDVTRTEYSREFQDKLHKPKLNLKLQNKFHNHVVELTAIAVSRRR